MNKLYKNEFGKYILVTNDGVETECTLWYEKKTNCMHIKLPKDNPTGRMYVRLSKVENEPYYFEDKLEHRTLAKGNWRSKLTEDEARELNILETRIEEIKQAAIARRPEPLTEEEKLEREIEKYKRRLERLRMGE